MAGGCMAAEPAGNTLMRAAAADTARIQPEEHPREASEATSFGVSVVVCCHNSAGRLRPTLEHLARQQVRPGVPWEVVLVDNASTDHTAEVARECWSGIDLAPLRIVREERAGLSAARLRGIQEARYETVAFIDDDNWVSATWIDLAHEIMISHPGVGACGGYNSPVFEGEPPAWFQQHQRRYAVGSQCEQAGDITDREGVLWGAGLCVRRSAMRRLLTLGFAPLLSDRSGGSLSSSGDYEICFALRLLGYRLVYDPRLRLRHFLPASRLEWRYLRRLARDNGGSIVQRDAYRFLLDPVLRSSGWWWRSWPWQVARALKGLLRQPMRFLLSLVSDREGDQEVLHLETAQGRIRMLARERGRYGARIRALQSAPWVRERPPVPDSRHMSDQTSPIAKRTAK
jgi:glycosyltransferase involved in cell wall biosynthesis